MNAVYWDKDKSMAEKRAEQSNPFSTGGGGISYEICVQAYFAIHIITGDELPFFKNTKATKMKLQGHYAGYNTDDCIVFGEDGRKTLCQIKNSVSITEHDNTFKAVITDAWNDYCNTELFNTEIDRIVLIVSGLSATDIANTTTLFDWARHCENSAEFVQKVTTEKFSSKEKRKKYQAIKTQLSVAKGENLSDDETWDFFRHYYIQVLELNRAESPLWVAVSSQLSNKVRKDGVANDLYHIIADYNQNAGTATREMLLRDLSLEGLLFDNALIKNIKNHNQIIAASMRNSINGKAIDRGDYVARIEESLLKNDILLVTGERGVGKTGIVKNYIDLHDNGTFYVFFRAEEFNKPSISGVFSELNWKFDLEQLQQVSLGYQRKCIVVESLERILENEHQKAFADLMTFVYQNTGWKIIASIRDYALQQVLMNFLAVCPLRTEYINIKKLDEDQLRWFIEEQSTGIFDHINSDIFELARIPVYLDFIIRAVNQGFILSKDDTFQKINDAIWQNVIMCSSNRRDGLPMKRDRTFTNIAIQRAKQLRYEVESESYDVETIERLEADGLITVHNGNVAITHDVLEDWALERWIEKCFNNSLGDYRKFYEKIGVEQSICRAYRLWLIEKFGDDEFLTKFTEEVLIEAHDNYGFWADETIVAILYSGKLGEFLNKARTQILNHTALLERMCFMIRVAAKKPDESLRKSINPERPTEQSSFILLKPEGRCWNEFIYFLYKNREALSVDFYPHCTRLLSEWIKVITIGRDSVDGSREAGLLSLFVIKKTMEEAYKFRNDINQLLEVAISCYGSIQSEFDNFVNDTIFNEEERRHYYIIDDLARFILTDFSCCHIAKYNPDLLIRIAKREWLIAERPSEDKFPYDFSRHDDAYGVRSDLEHYYNQASGYREPFRALFRLKPDEAIKFVLKLCNSVVNNYINYCIKKVPEGMKGEFKARITSVIKKDNGDEIEQIAIPEFWCAYRGTSAIPGVIKCALMALENYLINYFECFSEKEKHLDTLIEYLVTNSNSVLITAVVASVLTANKSFTGRSSLLILQNFEFYRMDLSRVTQEFTSGWFGPRPYGTDKLFFNERKKSNEYKWRKESLEDLCLRLQFTKLKEEVLKVIDQIEDKYADDVSWQFCRHRIDSRLLKIELDPKEDKIYLVSDVKDGKLKGIQENHVKENQWITRYNMWLQWSDECLKSKKHSHLPIEVSECVKEMKTLIDHYSLAQGKVPEIYLRGINQTLAIILCDYSNELVNEEMEWLVEYVVSALKTYDQHMIQVEYRYADMQGICSFAMDLPQLSEVLSPIEWLELAICLLTSYDYKMRIEAANSISETMWERDESLARKCIAIIAQFDLLETEHLSHYNAVSWERKQDAVLEKGWIKSTRGQLLEVKCSQQEELSMAGTAVLLSALPINGKNYENTNRLYEKCICKICSAEQELMKHDGDRDHDSMMIYEVSTYISNQLGNLFYNLSDSQLLEFKISIEKLGLYAPNTCKWVMLRYKLLCENDRRFSHYWRFWSLLTEAAKKIAVELNKGQNYRFREEREMLLEYMYVNCPWQPLDYKNNPVKDGADCICDFAKDTMRNPIVYEGLASLMYNFPDSFLEKGIALHNHITLEELIANFNRSQNSAFYMENNIYTYVMNLDSNTIPTKIYKSCARILDALIKQSSSKAYYIRDYLLKSKKMV